MKVYETLWKKYREWLKRMTKREWENIKVYAKAKKMSIPDYMMLCLEITETDYKQDNVLRSEIWNMHKEKLLASNKHRQEHGHIDRFWLTKRGLKEFNAIYNSSGQVTGG